MLARVRPPRPCRASHTLPVSSHWPSNFPRAVRRFASHPSKPPEGSVSKPRSRSQRYARKAALTVAGLGLALVLDSQFNASAITRNLRTVWTCGIIALDYKINFTPDNSDGIPALQERVAQRVYDLLTSNGGLYIKIGQAFANNAALLPRPMQEKFAKLFDDAPQVPYSTVEAVFKSEFGRPPTGPNGVFEVFEEQAAASASIAQVHRAKLKTEDGSEQWVAVKIQKPDVTKQVEWDLGAFRAVMWIYEHWLFHLPVCFAVDFINDHLRRELDFKLEADNAQRTSEFVAKEPRLADRVYIPRVFPELSTHKVLVAEWIDGVRLSDRKGIERLMGEDASLSSSAPAPLSADRFPRLKGGTEWVMRTMIDLFSAQIFDWGWVHCDPHPGNIIIRPHPHPPRAGQAQFVLLDHGLYVRATPDFQNQYAHLWKALLTADFSAVKSIAQGWGIGTPDLFASATLMRPVRFKETDTPDFDKMNEYERGVAMKEKLKGFLTDTDKMPKELIFIGRNMRIVQGNNQQFASPVNRIRITGNWASRSLVTSQHLTFALRLREAFQHLFYLSVMLSIDVLFWASKVRQWVAHRLGREGESFEDELERSMRNFAKSNFGIDVPQGVFDG